jgi:CyaY protein
MTEREYLEAAEATLRRLETALEDYEDEIEAELAAGGVLELSFADDSKIIVNKQAAAQEIWVAAKSGGFHYRLIDGAWRDTRSGEELFAALSRLASAQAGCPVDLG